MPEMIPFDDLLDTFPFFTLPVQEGGGQSLTELICEWARRALRSTALNLPDATLAPFIATPFLSVLNQFPEIREVAGSDLSALAEGDKLQLAEGVGWLVAARWITLPRTEDDQIIVRAKISELEVTYKVTDAGSFAAIFEGEGYKAIYQMSMLFALLSSITSTGALSGILLATPNHVTDGVCQCNTCQTLSLNPFPLYLGGNC